MSPRKVYLLGLDGFDPELLSFFCRRKIMPRLCALLRRGVQGSLLSTIPAYTGPAWVSMVTGVNPGKHGIFGFTGRRPDGYGRRLLSSADVGAPALWRILNRRGIRTGIFNLPFTYPPEPVDGFMVSGMLTPNSEAAFTRPPAARRFLPPGYLIDVAVDLEKDSRKLGLISRLRRELKGKREALAALLDEYDPEFLMAVFVTPDRIQHLWYGLIRDGGIPPGRQRIRRGVLGLYRELDEAIGELHRRLGRDDVLLLASDHGFTTFRRTFYLNHWLLREGYLRLGKGGKGTAGLAGRLNRSGIKKFLPRSLLAAARARSIRGIIDWEGTRAYASPGMEEGVCLNLAGREPAGIVTPGREAGKLEDELRRGLLALEIPGRKSPVLKDLISRREAYRGELADRAADLILIFAEEGWNMSDSLLGGGLFREYRGRTCGVHRRRGFWGAAGGPVGGTGLPVEARIEDIAPTVLSLFGVPAPLRFDGRVIEEVVPPIDPGGEEIPPESLPPPAAGPFSSGEEEEVRRRLKGLGYL